MSPALSESKQDQVTDDAASKVKQGSRHSAFFDAEDIPDIIIQKIKAGPDLVEPDSPADMLMKGLTTKFYKQIPAHQFSVDGATYEWMDGVYFKQVNTIDQEGSFGADALL